MRRDVAGIVFALLCGGVVGADEPAAPDVEFLEYLGGLVEEDDTWIGPDDMTVAPGTGEEVVSDSVERPDAETEELQ